MTLEGALQEILEHIDANRDIFKLEVDYFELNERTQLQQDDIDFIMGLEMEDILDMIKVDKVRRSQFASIRQAVQNMVRTEIETNLVHRNGFTLNTVDRETEYTIRIVTLNPESEIQNQKYKYDVIEIHYDANEMISYKEVRKINLNHIFPLTHFMENVDRTILKDGSLTIWYKNGSKETYEILDPNDEPEFTRILSNRIRALKNLE